MSVAGHPDFTSVISFQPCAAAILCRGLNHWIAWESPNNKTLTEDNLLPKEQVLTDVDVPRLTHCSLGILAMSSTAASIVLISPALASRSAKRIDKNEALNKINVTVAAPHKVWRGRFVKLGLDRTGFSIKRCVIAATMRAADTEAIFPVAVMLGRSADERTRNGQCQRYQEYESLPSFWSGTESRIRARP
jgi:hypothetical protein